MRVLHLMLRMGRNSGRGNVARKMRSQSTMNSEIQIWTCQRRLKHRSLQQGRSARRTVPPRLLNQAERQPTKAKNRSRLHRPPSHERKLLLASHHHHRCQPRARRAFAVGRKRSSVMRQSRRATSVGEDCGHVSTRSLAARNARRTVASTASSESGSALKKGHRAHTVCD
jgi:hypothetical protein